MKNLSAWFFLVFFLIVVSHLPSTEPLQAQPNTDNMFIPEDTDSFDPGLRVGENFPTIRVLYRGREVTQIDQFVGIKGAVFFANRSADW